MFLKESNIYDLRNELNGRATERECMRDSETHEDSVNFRFFLYLREWQRIQLQTLNRQMSRWDNIEDVAMFINTGKMKNISE